MATQAILEAVDATPVWEFLAGLSWSDIPSDLSEIDENWCYIMVTEYCAGELEELAELVAWQAWRDMAYDLRDIWHDARAEDAQYLSGRW